MFLSFCIQSLVVLTCAERVEEFVAPPSPHLRPFLPASPRSLPFSTLLKDGLLRPCRVKNPPPQSTLQPANRSPSRTLRLARRSPTTTATNPPRETQARLARPLQMHPRRHRKRVARAQRPNPPPPLLLPPPRRPLRLRQSHRLLLLLQCRHPQRANSPTLHSRSESFPSLHSCALLTRSLSPTQVQTRLPRRAERRQDFAHHPLHVSRSCASSTCR